MTDDRMDARLRAAGERWRAAHESSLGGAAEDEIPLERSSHRPRLARRTATLLSVAAVALVAVAAGAFVATHRGGSTQSAATAKLTGTDWVLVDVLPRGRLAAGPSVPAHLRGKVRLSIENGRILGSDGCNAFSGPVQVGNGTLRVHDLASSAVACPASNEVPIGGYFSGTVRWSITGTTLTITKDGVGALTYRAPKPGSPQDLVDRTWILQAVERPKGDFGWAGYSPAPSSMPVRVQPLTGSTLFISTNGSLTADTRCGEFAASVRVATGTVTIRDRTFDPHSCPAPLRGNEFAEDPATLALRDALVGRISWTIDGDALKIGPAGGPVLHYRGQTTEPAPSFTGAVTYSGAQSGPIGPTATVSGSVSAAPRLALTDRTWHLSEVEQRGSAPNAAGSGLGIAFRGAGPDLRISADGSFRARVSDCESYQGRVKVGGTSLTIISRTLNTACRASADGNALRRVLGDLFRGTVQWRTTDHTLTLKAQRATAQYTDQPPAPSTKAPAPSAATVPPPASASPAPSS